MKKESKFFKSTKILCCAAMLAGLSFVIAYFCKMFLTITPLIRITFENLPIILSGIFFGPVVGLITGIASDLISTAVSQYGLGGINPIITLGAGCVGLFSGLIPLFAKKKNTLTLAASVYSAHLIGNILIKSLGLYLMYSYSIVMLLPRIPLYAVISTIEFIIVSALYKNKGIKKAIR